MAVVICQVCQAENADGEGLCKSCGFLLEHGGGGLAPSAAAIVESIVDACPACGAEVPDPANLVCVECLEPLTPKSSQSAAAPMTRREAGPQATALRLRFAERSVDVPRAGSLLLGRDPEHSPVAALFATHDNVSRRHATIGVEPDGRAWVRDEHSANGTYVNDRPVPSGRTLPLSHGDRLRMASDVVAQVEGDVPGGRR